MADKSKILEEGRYILATFPDVNDITSCVIYMKRPGSTSEEELSTTLTVDTINGVTVTGYAYQLTEGDITSRYGQYIFEPYIVMTDGYKGRREAFKLTVYDKYK